MCIAKFKIVSKTAIIVFETALRIIAALCRKS